jgi:PAS domain S-box-containing protein
MTDVPAPRSAPPEGDLPLSLREGELLRQLIESLDAAAWIAGRGPDRTLLVNRAWATLWGRPAAELIINPDLWREAVLPEERDRVGDWFASPPSGAGADTPRLDFRILRPDGEVRWVAARLLHLADPGGEGLLLVIAEDVTRRKDSQRAVESLIRATGATGPAFFGALTVELSRTLGTRFALVGWLLPGLPPRVSTLAFSESGMGRENFTYNLEGTPCEQVLRTGICFYPRGVKDLFPGDRALGELGIESYLGVPLLSSQGAPLGILAVMHDRPLPDDPFPRTILSVFAGRVAAEMERLRALESLQTGEERYRLLLESITDYLYTVTVAGGHATTTVHGPGCQAVTGYAPEDFQRDPSLWYTMIHPEDRQSVLERVDRTLLGFDVGSFEHRIIRKDGAVRWIRSTHVIRRDEAGEILSYDGIIVDVSERKAVEAIIWRSVEQYETIVNTTTDGFWIVDAQGRIQDVNRAYCAMTGYRREDLIGAPVSLVEVADNGVEGTAELWGYGESRYFETRHRTRDGRLLDLEICATPVEGGERTISFLRDITSRKVAEEQVRESERRFRSLYEAMSEGILIQDVDSLGTYRVVECNPAAVEMLDLPREILVGGGPDLLGSRLPPVDLYQRVAATGDPSALDLYQADLRRYLHFSIFSPSRGRCVTVVDDFTERHILEEELLVREKLESMSLLAGGIAHDFNNLLAAILANLSLARFQLSSGAPVGEILRDAEKATLRARDLTQQLLTFAKGGAPLTRIIHPGPVLRESCGFATRGTGVDCRFLLPADLWSVKADEAQLSQAIHNLVINAVQAMPHGGTLTLEGRNMDVGAETGLPLDPGPYVALTITDQGIGIPPQNLQKIFDPYFTTKTKGSGLGLAVTYSILRKHDGHITVTSEPGVGSSFTLYLPAAAATPVTPQREETSSMGGSGRILVMDDEEILLKVASAILTHSGYEVVCTREGAEALEEYRRGREEGRPFDLVIMDLTIPGGMGGRETIQELLRIDPGVRAIVSSGYSNDPIMAEYREYGFAGVVGKPYSLDDLTREVRRVLHPQE